MEPRLDYWPHHVMDDMRAGKQQPQDPYNRAGTQKVSRHHYWWDNTISLDKRTHNEFTVVLKLAVTLPSKKSKCTGELIEP